MTAAGPAPRGRREETTGAITRSRLFLSSYAPLLVIFALRFWDLPQVCVALFAVAILSVIDGWRLLKGASALSYREITLTEIVDQGGSVAGYLATYLLPFVSAPPRQWEDIAAYGVYFVVALIVYINSDLALINPTLYVLGRRVVKARHAGREVYLVCRRIPLDEEKVLVADFLDVYVEHKSAGGRTDQASEVDGNDRGGTGDGTRG